MISNYCRTFAALLTNISIKMKKYFAKDTNNDQTHWAFTVSKDGTIK